MSIANPFLHDKEHSGEKDANNKLRQIASIASVTVAVVLISIKFLAYMLTDSVSLLSSLMDSTIDVMASIVTLIGVRHAMQPADEKHRYGHGKLEALSAMAQAIFISCSAIFLFYEAMHRFIHPQIIDKVGIGYTVMGVSIALTICLVFFQRYVVKKTGSVAIEADHLHYKGDVLMNIGVIAALFLTSMTGWAYFDPIFACLIALLLLYGAKEIGLTSYKVLMDHELPEEDRKKIMQIAESHKKVEYVHDLRTRTTGHHTFIEFHLEMDGSMSLDEAHDITEEIEMLLYKEFPNADVSIHQEPAGIDDDRLDERISENI